jgi:hypothetical protein
MQHELLKYLSYENNPFPLLRGSLPLEFYEKILESWPTWQHETLGRNNLAMSDERPDLIEPLHDLVFFAWELFFKNIFTCNKTISQENIRIQYAENSVQDIETRIRGWHLDAGSKQLIVLWYFRDEKDHAPGGNLQLLNPINGRRREIPYESNSILIFPNFINCWHSISTRSKSLVPRRFINIVIEKLEESEKMHQYGNKNLTEYAHINEENYDDADVLERFKLLKKYSHFPTKQGG